MNKLLGSKLEVHLKDNEGTVSGMLFDLEDKFVYIQSDVNTFITIPTNNVKFYVSSSFQNASVLQNAPVLQNASVPQDIPSDKILQSPADNNFLTVCINNEIVSEITVSPEMNLGTCNEEVLQLIWSDPAVQEELAGRVQLSLEYDIGYANITTSDGVVSNNTSADKPVVNSFGMQAGGSAPANGVEMAQIISGGGKK